MICQKVKVFLFVEASSKGAPRVQLGALYLTATSLGPTKAHACKVLESHLQSCKCEPSMCVMSVSESEMPGSSSSCFKDRTIGTSTDSSSTQGECKFQQFYQFQFQSCKLNVTCIYFLSDAATEDSLFHLRFDRCNN